MDDQFGLREEGPSGIFIQLAVAADVESGDAYRLHAVDDDVHGRDGEISRHGTDATCYSK